MSEDVEIKGVIPNYYVFIIDKLNRIYDAWDHNQYGTALDRAIKLTVFLPKKLKTKIYDDKQRIIEKMKNVEKIQGYQYHQVQEKIQLAVRKIAVEELEKFMDKITDCLDEDNLLTQKYGVPTRTRDIKELEAIF